MNASLLIARRELRGGLRGFGVFLACLILGVAAIAAVGSVRVAIQEGLTREGAAILGGDAEMEFTYRFANETERAWMDNAALEVSEIVDFRSMAVVDQGGVTERALTQVKAVDDIYPIYGETILEPAMPLKDALAITDTRGAVAEQTLLYRLGIAVGDSIKLGENSIESRAFLRREPDTSNAGFSFGPRVLVLQDALDGSGLITEGTLFETDYRLRLPPETNLETLSEVAKEEF